MFSRPFSFITRESDLEFWWVINAVDKNSLHNDHNKLSLNQRQPKTPLNNELHINDGGESVNIYGRVQDEKPDLI